MSRLIFPTISSLKKETGINSYLVKLPFRNSILVGVLIDAGFINEKWPEEKGFAHLLEHLVLRGTKKFPTAKLLNKRLESVGGGKEGLTNVEYTLFKGVVPYNYPSLIFEILSEIIYRPLLKSTTISNELKVIEEEIKTRKNNLSLLTTDMLKIAIFKDIYEPIVVEMPDVSYALRKNILAFWERNYVNKEPQLIVIGNISYNEAIKNIKKFFYYKPFLNENSSLKPEEKKNYHLSESTTKIIQTSLINDQVLVNMGAPLVLKTYKEFLALHLYNAMLNYGVSSPFFQELREKRGLVYKIISEIIEYKIPLFRISFNTDKDYKKVINLVFDIMKKTAASDILLKEAKNKLIGRWFINLDNLDFILKSMVRDINLFGYPIDFSTTIKEIRNIHLRDIKKLVDQYLRADRFSFIIAKPLKR